MIKDFMTAYWGYLPMTKEPYSVHPKVNAFIGPSGHGKTTIWDGLRVVLGDAAFESNRKVGHYVNPKSTWAIVRVAFYNLPNEDGVRPFEYHGYKEDQVTVCCHVMKTDQGSWARNYYIFDGEFTALGNLATNTKAYRQCLKTHENYKLLLEGCLGLTPEFRNLMATNPDDVKNMIGLSSNKLFNMVFELKGLKEIKGKYDESKRNLNEQEIIIGRAEGELEEAKKKFEEVREKASRLEKYQTAVRELERTVLKVNKLEYWETFEQIKNLEICINKTLDTIMSGQVECNQLDALIRSYNEQINNLQNEVTQLNATYNKTESDLIVVQKKETLTQIDFENVNNEIRELADIKPEDKGVLKELLDQTEFDLNEVKLQHHQEKQYLAKLENRLLDLQKNKAPYQDFVIRFRSVLESERIPFIMLADCISVKPEYKKWQKSVEAFLGNNRNRLIVDHDYYLKAKKLQEKNRYKARISSPRAGRKNPKKDTSIPYPTIYSVLDIAHLDRVGGYLESLHDIYLVDTVEQGHELQKEGITSVTLGGLLQDRDGSISVEYHQLCCGQLAIAEEKSQVEEDLGKLKKQVKELKNKIEFLDSEYKTFNDLLKKQQRLEELPALKEKSQALKQKLTNLDTNIRDLDKAKTNTFNKILSLKDQQTKLNGDLSKYSIEKKTKSSQIEELTTTVTKYKADKADKQTDLNELHRVLALSGLSDDEIDFIGVDVQEQSFCNDQGERYTVKELRKVQRILEGQKTDYFQPGVNENILQLVKIQSGHVESLVDSLKAHEQERQNWAEQCEKALIALKNHIKTTMKEYINEFETLSDLLNAQAKGRLEENGSDPELWELHLSIGYDGKQPTPINGPHLSSGQKACTSLMLLLAAANNKRKGGGTPIMFLDEPKARVDDDRGNELGNLLQLTDVQYFITHQMSESLKSIDWIDHGYACSVWDPSKDFSPPLLLQKASRRV